MTHRPIGRGSPGLTPQQQWELRKKGQSQEPGKTTEGPKTEPKGTGTTEGGVKTEPKGTGTTEGGVKTSTTPPPRTTSEVPTSFTSVPQETVSKKESGTSTMDKVSQQVSKSGVERPDPEKRPTVSLRRSGSKTKVGEDKPKVGEDRPKVGEDKPKVGKGKTKVGEGTPQVQPQTTQQTSGSTGTTQTLGTPSTIGIPTSGSMDPAPVFNALKQDYPHLDTHLTSMSTQKVGIEVLQAQKGTSAYYDQPSNNIRVQNDGTLDLPKLKDNVLYESFNAWAHTEYKRLDKDLSSRNLSVPQYGEQKARTEAQVTIKYIDAILEGFKGDTKSVDRAKLTELARQVPPDLEARGAREVQDRLNVEAGKLGLTEKALRAMGWAERIAPGYVQNPQSGEHKKLENDFLAQPHQANPEKPRFGLSSKDLYSYEGVERQKATGLLGMLQAPLKGISSPEATTIRGKISGLRQQLEGLDNMPEGTDREKDLKANAKCQAYQTALQTIIREHPGMKSKFEPHLLSDGIKAFAGIT